jgi:16S rRNA processing protein RimM
VDKDSFVIGRLGAPKGVRGDLKVKSYSGESAHFLGIKEAELIGDDKASGIASGIASGGARKLRLKVLRVNPGNGSDSLTMAFEGYPSPETARELTGMEIVVPRAQAAPLGPDEWYVADLVGLSLVVEGKKVATVRSVLEGGADPWLEVEKIPETSPSLGSSGAARTAKRNTEGISLVPFRKIFVGEVDLKAGTIELLAPELLSLESPDK